MEIWVGPFRFRSRKAYRLQRWLRRAGERILPRRISNHLFLRSQLRQSGAVRLQGATTADPNARLAVAIRVAGGLGDYLVIARFLRDLSAAVEPFDLHIFSTQPKLAEFVFSFLANFRSAQPERSFRESRERYDAAIEVIHAVSFAADSINWARVSACSRFTAVLRRIAAFNKDEGIDLLIEHRPTLDGWLARRAVYMNERRSTFLHRTAGIAYGGDKLPVPAKMPAEFPVPPGAFVTVHNGYDTNLRIKGGSRHTKCWPHFGELVARIKEQFPGLAVVQLGGETSEPIAGVDHDLIGKTSFTEAAGLIAGARMHFDNEGGLAHVAACLGTRAAVMFGPTPVEYFSYDGNINVHPEFCGGCWWSVPDWMDSCPRGFGGPRCLIETSAERVFGLARPYLAAGPA